MKKRGKRKGYVFFILVVFIATSLVMAGGMYCIGSVYDSEEVETQTWITLQTVVSAVRLYTQERGSLPESIDDLTNDDYIYTTDPVVGTLGYQIESGDVWVFISQSGLDRHSPLYDSRGNPFLMKIGGN